MEEPGRARLSLWGWVVTIVGVAAVLAIGWWVTNSSLFDMRTLTVAGNRRFTYQELARMGGVDRDTNVLWFSETAVEDRLERNPWVVSAEVTRTLPTTLRLDMIERAAVALVARSGQRYLVAGDGMILEKADRTIRLPVVDGSFDVVTVGARIPPRTPGLLAVKELSPELRRRVTAARVNDAGILTLELRDGISVIYGDAGQAFHKARVLRLVLAWATRHGLQPRRVDVRAPVTPALLPVEPVPAAG